MHLLYENRVEAGVRLAKSLESYKRSDAVVMAIPRGGIPVAAVLAHRLDLKWNIIVTRKLPIPYNPEAGFGAVTADGSVVLNEAMVHGLQLTKHQIDEVAQAVKEDVVQRTKFFTREKSPVSIAGKTVIVVDDGLATGYSMLAAIQSLRNQNASKIIAASPIASRSAAALVERSADECFFEIVSPSIPFAVADFYVEWHDLSEDDLLPYLRAESPSPQPSPARGEGD